MTREEKRNKYRKKVNAKIEKLNMKISKRVDKEIAEYEAMCKSLFPDHTFKLHLTGHVAGHVTIDPPLNGCSCVNWFEEKDEAEDWRIHTICREYDYLLEWIEDVTDHIRIRYVKKEG